MWDRILNSFNLHFLDGKWYRNLVCIFFSVLCIFKIFWIWNTCWIIFGKDFLLFFRIPLHLTDRSIYSFWKFFKDPTGPGPFYSYIFFPRNLLLQILLIYLNYLFQLGLIVVYQIYLFIYYFFHLFCIFQFSEIKAFLRHAITTFEFH